MARRRMIDPNFWQSQDVAKLNVRQRLLAIGLFSNADDEGRGVANPAYVRAIVFPFDNFSTSLIKKDLEILCQVLNLRIYDVGGNKYYVWTKWKKWQRVEKPQPSIIPAPPWENSGNDSRNESGNDSGNDSRNESGNDSSLKEEKRREDRKERKRKEAVDRSVSDHKKDPAASDCQLTAAGGGEIFSLFEKEFGRAITPLEIEQIQAWLEKHDASLVKEALRRAVLRGKLNFRYIDRILLGWQKQNLRTLREVAEKDPLDRESQAAPDPPPAAREDRRREEKIAMARDYIVFTLGENPDPGAAAEIARGYGEELVPDILARLNLPPPGPVAKGGRPP